MSYGLKLSNLPEGISEQNIWDFFSKTTTDIKEIKIKKHSAKVFLEDEEAQSTCLMLDGEELLGSAVRVVALEHHSSSSDSDGKKHKHKDSEPEILASHDSKEEFQSIPIFKPEIEPPKIFHPAPEVKSTEKHEAVHTTSHSSEPIKIGSESELKKVIQSLTLPFRRHLPTDDSFKFVSDCQVFSLVVFLSLVYLAFHDLFD